MCTCFVRSLACLLLASLAHQAAALVPTRKSSRIRGEKPDLGVGGSEGPSRSLEVAESPSAQLLTSAEFFEGQGLPLEPASESDGKFYGWVEEETCLRYGIAGDPDTAWNKNGGGKFTFKIKKVSEVTGQDNQRAFLHHVRAEPFVFSLKRKLTIPFSRSLSAFLLRIRWCASEV